MLFLLSAKTWSCLPFFILSLEPNGQNHSPQLGLSIPLSYPVILLGVESPWYSPTWVLIAQQSIFNNYCCLVNPRRVARSSPCWFWLSSSSQSWETEETHWRRDGGSEKMRKIIPLLWIFTPSEIQIFTIECPYLRAGGSGVSRKMCSVLIRVLKKEKQLSNT